MKKLILLLSLLTAFSVTAKETKEEKRAPAEDKSFKILTVRNDGSLTGDVDSAKYSRVVDTSTGVVCYSVVPYGENRGAAISCVKVDTVKNKIPSGN